VNSPLDGVLVDLACPSATDCWAVGFANDGVDSLIGHFDGSSWKVTSAPDIGGASGGFQSVACTGIHNCWAVGEGNAGAIEHFDGTSWSIVASPNTGDFIIWGVACTSASSCWAVGANGVHQLINHFNGQQWSLVPNPALAATDAAL